MQKPIRVRGRRARQVPGAPSRAEEVAVDFDVVIRGGTVVDGTGAPATPGDVAIRDGRIAAVGQVDGTTDQDIDASGCLVTPGFVDIHTHLDAQLAWDPIASSSCW